MDDFVIITDDKKNIPFVDFLYVKNIDNKDIVSQYIFDKVDNIKCVFNIINQMFIDIPREDVYIKDKKIDNIYDILYYIEQNFLQKNKLLVYFFFTQICFVIPLKILYDMTKNINEDIIITDGGRNNINIYNNTIIVKKKLNSVLPDYYEKSCEMINFLSFDIIMEVDFVMNTTQLYIESVF
jgi:hypothetical protein